MISWSHAASHVGSIDGAVERKGPPANETPATPTISSEERHQTHPQTHRQNTQKHRHTEIHGYTQVHTQHVCTGGGEAGDRNK